MTDLFDVPFEEPASPRRQPQPRRRVLTVGELTARVRGLIEDRFDDVWVEGEVSNCKLWTTGHLYFTLKDRDAQVRAVMYRSSVRLLRFKVQDGAGVIVRGRLTVYEPKGEYQLLCDYMEPRGLGALQLAFEQLKRRLGAEGLFDAARKRRLPFLPRKIGVVTSLDGAAVRDIITVLRQRYGNAHVVIRPARVQGDGAAEDIARALAAIARVPGVDVVIVGRGGGSIEDLWAFNEEIVARAVAKCPVPVISAVGHETDVTIADFVADVRAATPSNAAEIVVSRKDELAQAIDRLAGRLRAGMTGQLAQDRALVHRLEARPALAGFHGRIAVGAARAGEAGHALRRTIGIALDRRVRAVARLARRLDAQDQRRSLGRLAARLTALDGCLDTAVGARRHSARLHLGELAGRLESLSPVAVLARGYAVCWNDARTAVMRNAADLRLGERVRVTLARGELRCDVVATSGGEAPAPR